MEQRQKALPEKELYILSIICRSRNPVTSKFILEFDRNLKFQTVHAALTKLLEKELIEVTGTTLSYKTTTRYFAPTDKAKSYIKAYIKDIYIDFAAIISKEEIIREIENL